MNKIELKPHNQETYDKLNDMLKTDNRVACVQPTGTGKSYIALRYIEDNPDKKILLLAPTDIILNQFKETVEKIENEEFEKRFFKNVSMAKYLDLGLTGFQNIYSESWDTIIMDEFHRTGASIWNTFIDKLISVNPNAKLIGLSATPIRFLDDYRNMGEEIFNGNYACHYNVNDAWKRGILPIPKYVLTDYQITERSEDYIRNKYPYATSKERIDWIIKQYLENGGNIHQIFKENLPNKNGKFIVFCSDSEHIKKMRPVVKGWLGPFNSNIHIYTTLAKDDEPDAELLTFKNDNSESIRLLFCVERLNEGLHLSNLDGIFMLRPTSSPIIYLQQMGRTLETDSLKEVVIFDLVNNFSEYRRTVLRYHDMMDKEIENLTPKERAEYNSYKEGKYDEFLEFDFVQKVGEICDLFDEIDMNSYEYNWNEMFELLKEYHAKYNEWPKQKDTYKGRNVGYWIRNQKSNYKNGILSEERQILLENIGYEVKENVHEKSWIEMYELLKEYHAKYNQWPKQKDTYKGRNIGYWIQTQKANYKKGILPKEHQILLENIGYELHENLFNKSWIEMYELLKEYHTETNQWPKFKTTYIGQNIGIWLRTQRVAYTKNKLSKEHVVLLESIGYELHENDHDKYWNEMYELLKEYHTKYNEWPKQKDTYKGRNIGYWIRTQKASYKKGSLSKEHQILLENIGYVLDENVYERSWNEMYELLKEYHTKYNEWPKSETIYKGRNIGIWIQTQKSNYKSGILPKKRVVLLESIGYKLHENTRDKSWNEIYELLKEYHTETNQWPKSETIYKGRNIGIWIKTQRASYKKNKLSRERVVLLENIGFVLDENVYERSWNEMYKLLKEYHTKYNQWPKQKETYKDQNIGIWIQTQKLNYKNGILPKERAVLLENIGYEVKENVHDKYWNEMYELLKEYHAKYNQWPKQKDTYKGRNVGVWILIQKRKYKNNILSKERVVLLENIGYELHENVHDKYWNEMYELLKEYYAKYNQWPKQKDTYKGRKVGNWLINQRKKIKKNKLSKEHEVQLENIGYELHENARDQSWNEMYELLKEYHAKYNEWPKLKTTYKGKNIGSWIKTQRASYKKNKLSIERVILFKNIGFNISNTKRNK